MSVIKKVTVLFNAKTSEDLNVLTGILMKKKIRYRIEMVEYNDLEPIFAISTTGKMMRESHRLIVWTTSEEWNPVVDEYKALHI